MTKKKKSELLPVGRKPVIDPEVIRKLEEAFSMDCTDGEACAYAGIGESTYYKERSLNPAFVEKMDRAKQFPFVLAKKTVRNALKDNDGALALKWMDRRQRDRYHTKVEQDVKEVPIEQIIEEVEAGTEYSERFQPEPKADQVLPQ